MIVLQIANAFFSPDARSQKVHYIRSIAFAPLSCFVTRSVQLKEKYVKEMASWIYKGYIFEYISYHVSNLNSLSAYTSYHKIDLHSNRNVRIEFWNILTLSNF